MESSKILLAIFLFGFICGAFGHSYVTSPISRSNQRQTNAGCRGPGCLGPCDAPLSRKSLPAIQVSRGQSISVQWPRNNHAGGFIRFAWAPTAQSDSHDSFDDNVQQINCHEVGGCGPDDASKPNEGDSGPADGSSKACTSNFTIPPHLSDGEWTLQWAWFGGAFSLGDYYSCVDYKIVGGQMGSFTPSFIGGDFANPNQQKCKFFNTDELHKCTNEPCNAPKFPAGQPQNGPPAYVQRPRSSTTTTTDAPSTTNSVQTPPPVTTGRAAPVTTGAPAPMTTGRAAPVTTGQPAPVTTGQSAPITTGRESSPSPIPPPSGSGNCAGLVSGTSSLAFINSAETWSNGKEFRMVARILSQDTPLTNWVLDGSFGPSITISVARDGGVLACQANGRASFKPVGAWANNIPFGKNQTIEIVGRSTVAVNSQSLLNTVFTVYKQ